MSRSVSPANRPGFFLHGNRRVHGSLNPAGSTWESRRSTCVCVWTRNGSCRSIELVGCWGLHEPRATRQLEEEMEGARRGSKPPISPASPPPSSVRVVFCIVHLGWGLYGTHWQDGIKDMSSPLANNRLHVRRPTYTTPGWPLRLFGHRVQRRVLHCSWALAVQHTQSVHMYMKICRASFVQVLLVASSSSYLLRLPAMEP